jgi:hypothetical protein
MIVIAATDDISKSSKSRQGLGRLALLAIHHLFGIHLGCGGSIDLLYAYLLQGVVYMMILLKDLYLNVSKR